MAKRYHEGKGSRSAWTSTKLPKEAYEKEFPIIGGYIEGGMFDDAIDGVDAQMSLDRKELRSGFKPKKI